jgi:hypothetical protein
MQSTTAPEANLLIAHSNATAATEGSPKRREAAPAEPHGYGTPAISVKIYREP